MATEPAPPNAVTINTTTDAVATNTAIGTVAATPPVQGAQQEAESELHDSIDAIVYGLFSLLLKVYIYIGSTKRGDERGCEHFNLASGARRVVTAFAQSCLQPTANFFRFDPLWKGSCSPTQLKAIEQHLMDKHDTRVYPRPTNGIVKDIDLFVEGVTPRQLNVNRSCTDGALVEWAARRVAKSTALVSLSPVEKLAVQYTLDTVRLVVDEAAAATAQTIISQAGAKYARYDPLAAVAVQEIHADLNTAFRSTTEEDGAVLRECLLSKLQWYNSDKRGVDHTVIASVAAAEFAVLAAATTVVTVPPSAVTQSAREMWVQQESDTDDELGSADQEPIEVDPPNALVEAPVAMMYGEVIEWLKTVLVRNAGSITRLCDVVDALEKNPHVMSTIARDKQGDGSSRLRAFAVIRDVSVLALGAGHAFIVGTTANKSIYYGKGTDIGRAHGGGVRVPGWHLVGFRFVGGSGGGASSRA